MALAKSIYKNGLKERLYSDVDLIQNSIVFLHEAVIRELAKSEGSDSSLQSCKDQFG